MAARKAKAHEPVAKKIKKIRQKKGLTFDMLANETGLAVDKLKKIESGDLLPPVGTLLLLSRAFQIDSSTLLNDTDLDNRAKAFSKRTENYAYTTLTPGADTKRMKAFRITVAPMQAHKGVGYQHEGEEFVYVLGGNVEVIVGEHPNVLSPGGSLHFNSGIRHQIRNISEETAELLVVVCEP